MRSFFGEHLSTSVHLHGFFVLRPSHHCGSQRNSSRSETPVPTPLPSFLVIYLQIALEFNCMFWFDHDDRKICSADGHSWHHVHQSSARPKALLELLALFCFFFQKIEWMDTHPQPTLPKSIHWRSLQPYSSTCIGGEAADCQEAQEDGDAYGLGHVFCHVRWIFHPPKCMHRYACRMERSERQSMGSWFVS